MAFGCISFIIFHKVYISNLNLVFRLSMKCKSNHTSAMPLEVMVLNDETSGCPLWDVGIKFTLYGLLFILYFCFGV